MLGDRPEPARPAARGRAASTAAELLDVGATPGDGHRGGPAQQRQRRRCSTSRPGSAAPARSAIFNLMEDAATAEIARSQVWQWLHNDVVLDDGRTVTRELVERIVGEELAKHPRRPGAASTRERLDQARRALHRGGLADDYAEFLTTARLRADAGLTCTDGAACLWPVIGHAAEAGTRRGRPRRSAAGSDRAATWAPHSVLTDLAARRTYDCDGLTDSPAYTPATASSSPGRRRTAVRDRRRRGAVAPRRPFVARGSGTGLSGGALPLGRRRRDRHLADARASSRSTRPTSAPSSSRASSTSTSPAAARRTATTTRPTRPASRSARSAATWPRTPAARTA